MSLDESEGRLGKNNHIEKKPQEEKGMIKQFSSEL